MQRHVPVAVARHPTAPPLVGELMIFQRMMTSFPLTLFFFFFNLALDGVPGLLQPGVVVRGVEHQPFLQIPTCVFTHLVKRVKRRMKV